MKNLHAKPARRSGGSPCCRGGVIRFGNRRRQCILCRKTWRIRQKKRGRKTKRVSQELVARYINQEIPTSYTLAKINKRQSKDQRERAIRKSLRKFVKATKWPALPCGEPIIVVADAMIVTIDRRVYAAYFIVIKRILDAKAVIAKPYIRAGTESWLGWQQAFSRLPEAVLASIYALVCDGHNGLRSVALHKKWLIQQCNFHAIARMQGRRSRWVRSRHRAMGEAIYRLINDVLTNPSEEAALDSASKLWEISRQTSSRNLKTYLSGFSKRYREYRTYLEYPELHLPRTSNSVESLIGSVRKLCGRAHGFSTIRSFALWISALLKKKKCATCNGYLPTKLTR